jgi:hypothetical protein
MSEAESLSQACIEAELHCREHQQVAAAVIARELRIRRVVGADASVGAEFRAPVIPLAFSDYPEIFISSGVCPVPMHSSAPQFSLFCVPGNGCHQSGSSGDEKLRCFHALARSSPRERQPEPGTLQRVEREREHPSKAPAQCLKLTVVRQVLSCRCSFIEMVRCRRAAAELSPVDASRPPLSSSCADGDLRRLHVAGCAGASHFHQR